MGRITGTILNRENLPIEGATIEEIETGKIAISDKNGHFSLDVQSPISTLKIRHVSYNNSYILVSEAQKIIMDEKSIDIGKIELEVIHKKPNYIGLYVVGITALVGLIYLATQKPVKNITL